MQDLALQSAYHNDRGTNNFIKKIMALPFPPEAEMQPVFRNFSGKLWSRFCISLSRDLKIPGRLPGANYSSRHAHENFRIIYLPSSSRRGWHFARLADVSKTWIFCSCFVPRMLRSTLFSVLLIRMFPRFTYFMIVVYNTTLRYENVNKSIRLFVFQSLSVAVTTAS